jgi:phospholipase/carboxylesterase
VIRELRTGRHAPKSGQVARAVAFLHGYGADGADLLGLADVLAPHLPDTLFLAPDAPEPCRGNPFGRQWFPIPRLDGSTEAQAADSLEQSAADLNSWIDGVLGDTGLAPEALALVGFSQGTMMSLHVAPRRAEALGGVVGFSGRMIGPEKLAAEAVSRPPVLLVHGDQDPMVSFESMAVAEAALKGVGVEVRTHCSQGVGHGIAPDGLSLALAFLRAHLPA